MDSDSSDDRKRKAEEELIEMFKKGKKLSRSPQESRKKQDEKLDTLTELVKEILKDVKEVKQSQSALQDEIRELKRENNELKQENTEIKKDMENLKGIVERLEKNRIKNNVVITGLKIEKTDREYLKKEMEDFLINNIGTPIKVTNAFKLGPKTCKVELENTKEKNEVMKNKNKLKNNSQKIYINNELTKTEMDIQKEIKKIAEQEKGKGKDIKMGFQKLIVDHQVWTWDKKAGKLKIN